MVMYDCVFQSIENEHGILSSKYNTKCKYLLSLMIFSNLKTIFVRMWIQPRKLVFFKQKTAKLCFLVYPFYMSSYM